MLATTTCLTADPGDHLLQSCGEVLQDDDDLGTGVLELVRQLTGRVERIDVDHDMAGAQHAGDRNRILQHVRHHQRDAGAFRQPPRLQPGAEVTRQFIDLREKSSACPC